jgi:hypothetical protein
MIPIIILAVVGAVVVAAISPKFRQMVRILFNGNVDKATTAIQKEEDEYEQLLAQGKKQREAVATVMARAQVASHELTDLAKAADDLKNKYKLAKTAPAGKISDETLNAVAEQWKTANDAVEAKRAMVTELEGMATEAQKTLETTQKAMVSFREKIKSDKSKAELTKALNVNADALQTSKDVLSRVANSTAGKASEEVDLALEQARAKTKLGQGSKADIEMAQLDQDSKASAGRNELDAMLGLDTKPAPAVSELDAMVSGKPDEAKA